MKTKSEWNDDEWEWACMQELEARRLATSNLGPWSDDNLFEIFGGYGVLRGVNTEYEDADKLLSLACFFSEIRLIAGMRERPFVKHSDDYLESHGTTPTVDSTP